jgi:hypothetical protein
MNTHRSHRVIPLLVGAMLTLAGAAHAAPAGKKIDPLRLQYERERADCTTGKTQQPRDTCLHEAAAAYAQARRGTLVSKGDSAEQWAANALKRCEVQPAEERGLCERRVREGDVLGSVEAGGQIKSLTIRSTDIPKAPGS